MFYRLIEAVKAEILKCVYVITNNFRVEPFDCVILNQSLVIYVLILLLLMLIDLLKSHSLMMSAVKISVLFDIYITKSYLFRMFVNYSTTFNQVEVFFIILFM